jgi:hypothetical protein
MEPKDLVKLKDLIPSEMRTAVRIFGEENDLRNLKSKLDDAGYHCFYKIDVMDEKQSFSLVVTENHGYTRSTRSKTLSSRPTG